MALADRVAEGVRADAPQALPAQRQAARA